MGKFTSVMGEDQFQPWLPCIRPVAFFLFKCRCVCVGLGISPPCHVRKTTSSCFPWTPSWALAVAPTSRSSLRTRWPRAPLAGAPLVSACRWLNAGNGQTYASLLAFWVGVPCPRWAAGAAESRCTLVGCHFALSTLRGDARRCWFVRLFETLATLGHSFFQLFLTNFHFWLFPSETPLQ